MNDLKAENKARNREIAENEAERQTVGDIRVSGWAIAVAVIIGLAAVGLGAAVQQLALGVVRQPLAGQQIVGRAPARQVWRCGQARRSRPGG